MKKIVGLGACVYDTLINCAEYPIEDTKYKSNGVFVSGGSPVGNALVVVKKLGVNASVSGLFANVFTNGKDELHERRNTERCGKPPESVGVYRIPCGKRQGICEGTDPAAGTGMPGSV